eukprot:61017_1
MACFFGSNEGKEKTDALQAEILSLKRELIALTQKNIEADASSSDSDDDTSQKRQADIASIQNLEQELEEFRSTIQDLQKQCEDKQNALDEMTAENDVLKASQKLLKQKNKEKDDEIVKLKQMNETAVRGALARGYHHDEEKQQPSKTARVSRTQSKGRKYNLNKLEDQIQVLYSEGAKARSVLLCTKVEIVPSSSSKNKDKPFGFQDFLRTSMGDKVVNQLFSKFKSNTVDGKQLTSLLTLAVIIYRVKVHKMKTGSSTKPAMDSSAIKGSVEHLAAWIIRTFGEKTDQKKRVSVPDESGKIIKAEYRICNAKFDKATFQKYVTVWIQEYIKADGRVDETKA